MINALSARLVVLLAAVELVSSVAGAAPHTLWEIGRFDSSSSEFKFRADYNDVTKAPVYVIGKSDPARDWCAFQPASSPTTPGYPLTVEFELPQTPRGLYTLTAALLVEAPGLPVLQVEINGHRGWFYQHPKLIHSTNEFSPAFFPVFSESRITIALPIAYLNRGANKLVLTAIEETAMRSTAPLGRRSPGIFYDALELQHEVDAKDSPAAVTAEVIPTVFYKSKGGKLFEVVEAFIRFPGPLRQAAAKLTMGSYTADQRLAAGRDFGDQRVEWEVPEFAPGTKCELAVTWEGAAQHFSPELAPAKKWTVFLVPHQHLDIGFTDYQGKVAERQSRTIDEALKAVSDNPDFRYNIDGYWAVEEFLKGRSRDQQDRFLSAVRENKLLVPAQYAHPATGFPALESLIRSLYPSHRFHSQNGTPFDYANSTDVPSFTWSYASVLASAGLKYFVSASNNHNAPILLYGRLHQNSPFWWEGPDHERILMWYSRHYFQVMSIFGLDFETTFGRESLPLFLQIYSHPEYHSDGVLMYGTGSDNTGLHPAQITLAATWNKTYAYPKLQYSGFSEAMGYIARQAGDFIPVVRGDGGPYWEDGIPADAYYAGLARESEHRALAAEKFSTVAALLNPIIRPDRQGLEDLWRNIFLYNEHTFEDAISESDPESRRTVAQREVKDSRATQAKMLVDHVLQRGLAAIADLTDNKPNSVIVFNPLNWTRSGLVEIDVSKGAELTDLTTGKPVAYERLAAGKTLERIRFEASDVPPVGYKSFAVRASTGRTDQAELRATASGSEPVLENTYYRVTLDPESGAVRSIFDKENRRELVDSASPYRLGQYVYVTGADESPNRLVRFPNNAPLPKLETHGSGSGRIISVARTPFGTVAHLISSSVNTPRIETEIILPDREKKIDLIYRVQKTRVYTKEGVYFAFPFAMDRPDFKYDIQNGFVDPRKDQIPGAGKEWFSVQGWVAVEQDKFTTAVVPVDASLVTFGDIVRGTFPREFGERRGTVFSYVMNNYWEDNFVPAQGGDFTFRYVLTSGAELKPEALSRLAWSAMATLETNEIRPQDQGGARSTPLDSAQASFLQIKSPNILLVNWKMAEDEHGTILRLLETAGKAGEVAISSPWLAIDSAWLCSAMEENQRVLPVSAEGIRFAIKPFQIVTLRVEMRGAQKLAAAY